MLYSFINKTVMLLSKTFDIIILYIIIKGGNSKMMNENIIKEFSSRSEAAKWLQENNYTKSKDIDNIIATIGRVANGQRTTAYGIKWENIL